jgi:CBS-domain-containing membrane protein
METIKVEDVYHFYDMAAVAVPEDLSLRDVVAKFAFDPNLRAIFLYDHQEKFTCMLSRVDVMRWAHLQLFEGKGINVIKITDFFRIKVASEAKALTRREMIPYCVRESDTLHTALKRMIEYEEDIIPVLDQDDRIVGDLRLSEVLLKTLEMNMVHDDVPGTEVPALTPGPLAVSTGLAC